MTQSPEILWKPNQQTLQQANLKHYMDWLFQVKGLQFDNYFSLWNWSTENMDSFWQSLIEYFNIKLHTNAIQVTSDNQMPFVKWFEGATLNYTEEVFRRITQEQPAIIYLNENGLKREINSQELKEQVAAFAHWLLSVGVQKGDRVAGYLPNIPEATVAMLATVAIGAVWTSASPDFGAVSVIERFQQTAPKVLISATEYSYNGKLFDRTEVVQQLADAIPSVEQLVSIGAAKLINKTLWTDILKEKQEDIPYAYVDFLHPIWILYSSGTTGKPKAITHSQGGILLEHLKYLVFHNDVKPGERYFWFSTTGWMMWNFVQSVLLTGATVVLYDGSPSYPTLDTLWKLIDDVQIAHFGTSAPFVLACMTAGISLKNTHQLTSLRSISSTGAPLPPEGFLWLKEHVKDPLWVVSMSGGTDLCTAFVGGVPTEPVYMGEIQGACLGAAIDSFDEKGYPLRNVEGEMVLKKPMPSMPVYFWGDENFEKYKESYFEMYPDIWRHGDWLTVTDRHTMIISGRSDATLNRNGIRIGTAEIYRVIDKIAEIADSLIVNIELKNGEHYMPLFVKMKEGQVLTQKIQQAINQSLKQAYSPRHVPDVIFPIEDIPYTISGKKMEAPVKKIMMGIPIDKAANTGSMRNPESLNFFLNHIIPS